MILPSWLSRYRLIYKKKVKPHEGEDDINVDGALC